MEDADVLRGYTISVNWAALGYSGVVYLSFTFATGANVANIVRQLRDIPELVELGVVTGNFDLIARFRIQNHGHLQKLILDRIWPIPGVERVETFLGLGDVVQERTEITLPKLLAQLDKPDY